MTVSTPPRANLPDSRAPSSSAIPRPSPLTELLYYLHNLRSVINWVLKYHSDLLSDEEDQQLTSFLNLPESPQALLARMILRKGEYFRDNALTYQEVPELQSALKCLSENGFITQDPVLPAGELFRLCRRDELQQLLAATGQPDTRKLKKSNFLPLLEEAEQQRGEQSLTQWWPKANFKVISLCCQGLFDRIRVMFFGNAHQDWSEFVLTELGHQRYETVAFSSASRAFQSRAEVDTFLALALCQRELEETGDCQAALTQLPESSANSWLSHRRDKLLFHIARQAERQGELDLAIALYQASQLEEATVRGFRLREKCCPPDALLKDLNTALQQDSRPLTQMHLERIQHRVGRKAGQTARARRPSIIAEENLNLPSSPTGSIEAAVAELLGKEDGIEVFYTENALLPGLLGLLLWPALFAPLPGAFFHPFQAGPADLFRPDFITRRANEINQGLNAMESGGYRQHIGDRWQEKFGTSCSLVNWVVLERHLVDLALEIIPAEQLQSLFKHLLTDLRHHRSGMPDLILFDTQQHRYRFIEVKGPGDRLQDHQRLWLEAMTRFHVPVSVMSVTYGNPA